ncbi:MAG: lysine 2,3-aminomutase, partial [Desulfobacteraceae bacterium]
NHPAEITRAVETACTRLADRGIALGSQTVLLKGVNDDPDTLGRLMMQLLAIRVRPYYLHQLDHVRGTAHFKVPLERALELVATLRGRLSGMAVPHFMIDLPKGGGKIALTPETIVEKGVDCWWIRNWQGRRFAYDSR